MKPGDRIGGKYVLGERIAAGGMAEVWAARVEGPEGFSKAVALKFIIEPMAGDPEHERLFVREARLAAQLSHPNLVTVFDFDKVDGRPYIAMERVDGCDARRLLDAAKRSGRALPAGLALHLGAEVLKGLRHVHERHDAAGRPLGLVHRDVSPHNVLVGFAGEVKLSDFGIATAMAGSLGTRSGQIRGKLAYASPEQVSGEMLDHRTDQFAAGVILWEALSGARLFEGHSDAEILGRVMRCHVPALADSAQDAVVRRMLARRREERFPSTAEALAAVLALPGRVDDGAALGVFVRSVIPDPADGWKDTDVIPRTLAVIGSADETRTRLGEPAAPGAALDEAVGPPAPTPAPVSAPSSTASIEAHVPSPASGSDDAARGATAAVPKERSASGWSGARLGLAVAAGVALGLVIAVALALGRRAPEPGARSESLRQVAAPSSIAPPTAPAAVPAAPSPSAAAAAPSAAGTAASAPSSAASSSSPAPAARHRPHRARVPDDLPPLEVPFERR